VTRPDDVYPDDMEPQRPDDFEQLLDSQVAGAASEYEPADLTADFIQQAYAVLRDVGPPAPARELNEFIGVSTSTAAGAAVGTLLSVETMVFDDERKSGMLATLIAAAATTGGKILVGAAAVFAVAGGAQATGVVDFTAADESVQVATVQAATVQVATQPDIPGDEVLGEILVNVDGAGSVVLLVEDGALRSVSVVIEDGWTALEEENDGEVFVVFTNVSGDEVVVTAVIEDDLVRVKTRGFNTDVESFFSVSGEPVDGVDDDDDGVDDDDDGVDDDDDGVDDDGVDDDDDDDGVDDDDDGVDDDDDGVDDDDDVSGEPVDGVDDDDDGVDDDDDGVDDED
jgi:hypothetical protein